MVCDRGEFCTFASLISSNVCIETMEVNFKDKVARRVVDYYSQSAEGQSLIVHTQCVVGLTRMIALGEGCAEQHVARLEVAAWLHNIGKPQALKFYGNALPPHTMKEGKRLTKEWLEDEPMLTTVDKQWLVDVVGHLHIFRNMQELEALPLQEADIIVNFWEGVHQPVQAKHYYEHHIHTSTGRRLFAQFFLEGNEQG